MMTDFPPNFDECGIKYFTDAKVEALNGGVFAGGNRKTWKNWAAFIGEGGDYHFGDTPEEAWRKALRAARRSHVVQ